MQKNDIDDPFQIDNAEEHDLRYFAMLQDAVAVSGDSRLEGGKHEEALAYYKYLLNIKLPNCPLNFQLTDTQSKAINENIANIIQMTELLQRSYQDETINSRHELVNVISAIQKFSSKSGVCYMPSGYNNNSGGHFAALKLRKLENGHFAFSVLNHGEGMQYHQALGVSGTKEKRSYQSNEFEIDLQTDNGRDFLEKILELRFDLQKKLDSKDIINAYSSDDLYGLLKLYGKKIPLKNIKEKAVTPQRSGTCPVTNTHAIARDVLIDNAAEFKSRKRYHFVLKLRSLIDGFNKYRQGKYSYEVLEWALKEFSTRLNKQYGDILSDAEMIYCSQLQMQIQERLDHDKTKLIQKKCEPQPLPIFSGDAPKNNQNIFNISKLQFTEKKESLVDEKKPQISMPDVAIKPADVIKLLQLNFSGGELTFPVKKIYDIFNSLPHCSGLIKDSFWDNIPEFDIKIIIMYLSNIVKNLRSSVSNSPLERAQTFAIALMAYDIAAQLAPRYVDEFYGGFKLSDKYTFGLDDIYSEQDFFTDPVAYHTVKRIARNFEQRAQNKQRIFSNAVNYRDNEYDHTIHYVIRVLLTETQRDAIANARMQEENKNSASYSDVKLFEYIMQHLDLQYKTDYITSTTKLLGWNINVLDQRVVELIRLAATAHALGNYTKTYQKSDENNCWFFNENRFHQEVKRQTELEKNTVEVDKHIPQIKHIASHAHYRDFSENTIYHPRDNLKKLQNDYQRGKSGGIYQYSPRIRLQPYQLYLSGSIKPSSTIWELDEKKQLIYEELNEDFRHIECSPNLQVVRTLAWATGNLDKLSNKDVRARINELLFQYGKLDNAFANQLEPTILNMNRFFTSIIDYCKNEAPNDSELLFWASNVAFDLRYHLEVAAKFYKLPIKKFTLPSFQDLLLSRIKSTQDSNIRSRLASQVIRDFRNKTPLLIEDCCLLLTCSMVANLGTEGGISDEIWQKLNTELIATVSKEKTKVTKILNQILQKYIQLKSVKDWHLNGSELQDIDGNFKINLMSGTLQLKGMKEPKDRTEKTIADNKELFNTLHLTPNNITLFYSDDSPDTLRSADGEWLFSYSASSSSDTGSKFSITSTYQLLNIEGITSKFKLLDKKEVSEFFKNANNPFESQEQCCTSYQYWQSLDDNDLIFIRQENGEFAYNYSKESDFLLIYIVKTMGKDVSTEFLQEISKKNNRNPILIKYHDEGVKIFGFYNNAWKLTELDNNNTAFMKAIYALPSPHIPHPSGSSLFSESDASKINNCDLPDEIRQEITSKKANTSVKNQAINQLKLTQSGNWLRNGKLLLNLLEPQTDNEEQWKKKLSSIFGILNVRCIAALTEDKSKYIVERIEHLTLGLSFVANEEQQLISEQFPGYHLSNEPSLFVLNGLPNTIILENNMGDKKYLIPAFSLSPGEKNNALNHENIIDYENLCNKSQPYYSYIFNSNNELVGDSVESNLYLAILYRSQGDFEKAIRSLDRCKTHKNINAQVVSIALQVLKRKIKSPMGAAFDLKLQCYLQEHQRKWSKDTDVVFEPVKFPLDWEKWIKEQLQFYKNTFSSYKKGIAIIPSYCRLTEQELAILQPPSDSEKLIVVQKNRFQTVSKLPEIVLKDKENWQRHVEYFRSKIERNIESSTKGLPHRLTTWRLYANGNEAPGFHYIVMNFNRLFEDAISYDAIRLDRLHKTLFSMLQNDADPKPELFELIALLNFTSKFPEYFKNFILPKNSFDLITKVGEIFIQHRDEVKNKTAYLFEPEESIDQFTTAESLPSDFISKAMKFNISVIHYEHECKHPLSDITKHYFTKTNVPVSKSDFSLQLSGLPDATLLEKRLFEHFEKGHKENQNKLKAVYHPISVDSLKDLKNDLDMIKKNDQIKLNKLKTSLQRANKTPLDDKNATATEKAKAFNLLQARASGQKNEISISDLFTAFLQQNPALLTEQNPFLEQEDIDDLFGQLADYALLHSRIDQINQALDIVTEKNNFSEKEIEPYELQLFAGILDKPRAYNIKQYPEFLVYEYATHRLLREDQVKILINLIEIIEKNSTNDQEMHHALLQFAAGGGKTSVLIPILAQRFARKGFLPVIFNTNELYQIGLEDIPKNLRASFQQNIEVIERELEHVWTAKELNQLLKDLERWKTEGKCLLLKPVTWHSINITRKLAYFNSYNTKSDLAKAAEDVLNFFKTKSVKLEDECHIVSDPMQQSIKTFGRMQKIPDEQLDLLLRYYDYIMGNEEKSADIVKLAGIKTNRKRSIKPHEFKTLQEKLANVIVNEEIFKDIPREMLIGYFLQADKKRPEWLRELFHKPWDFQDKIKEQNDEKIANAIVLARAFLKTHLPHILSLQYLTDYGTSIHKGDLTAAPKHESKDVTSHFGDHNLVAALTIQLYQQRGLLPSQVEQLLDKVIKEHRQERLWNHDFTTPTQAEAWLIRVVPDKYPFGTFQDLTQEMKNDLSSDPNFFKNPDVIKKYLLEFALPQIKVPDERQTSTAAELQAGFNRSILLSATPSLPEIYPAFLIPGNCFLEEAFEAQVIDTMLQQQNKGLCILKKTQNPTDFFKQFPQELLTKMTTLIDRGSLLTDFEAQDIIMSYLGFEKNNIASQTAAFFSKQSLHLKSKATNIKEVDIPGAGLVEALKKQGIKPEKFLLFLFLDLSKTTGTDIKRPYSDHAGLTVGKKQTVTETIQAAMRERQLLDENAQSITWLMFQALYREINSCDLVLMQTPPDINSIHTLPITSNEAYVCTEDELYYVNKTNKECIKIATTPEMLKKFKQKLQPSNESRTLSKNELETITSLTKHNLAETFDPRNVFYWMIKNEAHEIESKLINRAYQGIYQAITEIVWQEIQRDPQLFYSFNGYSYALQQRQELLPYFIYEIPSSEGATTLVLRRYLEELIEKFKFKEKNVEIPNEVMARIDKIIKETAALIATLQDPPKNQLGAEVQQEMQTELQQEQQQEQEQRMKTKLDKASDFVYEVEEFSIEKDNLETIFNLNIHPTQRYQTPKLPDCDGIKQPALLMCQEHFAVTQQSKLNKKSKTDNTIEQLKPIKMLLVKIMPNNKMQFVACTAAGAEYYSFLMNNNMLTEKDPAYALITTEGEVLHANNNIFLPTCRQLMDTEECKKMLTYAQFLNGKISNPIILSQIIKEQGWRKQEYEQMANAIASVHVSQYPVSLLKNAVLERLCGWSNKKPEITMTTKERYRKKIGKPDSLIERQTLQPVATLDNHMEDSAFPITSPKHALEGYVLGEEPTPIAIHTDELKLSLLVKNIKLITNKNNINGKDLAINKLDNMTINIVNSLKSTSDKIQELQDLSEFLQFDQLLETINAKLQKYTGADYLIALKAAATKAISNAYFSFANGKSINDCRKYLKETLEALVDETATQYKLKDQTRIGSIQLPFSLPIKSTLVTLLSGSIAMLEKPILHEKTGWHDKKNV